MKYLGVVVTVRKRGGSMLERECVEEGLHDDDLVTSLSFDLLKRS